jgi:hypothetical protein
MHFTLWYLFRQKSNNQLIKKENKFETKKYYKEAVRNKKNKIIIRKNCRRKNEIISTKN